MKKTNFNLGSGKKPEIEINKTTSEKFWQNPNFTFWLYLIFILISFPVKATQKVHRFHEQPMAAWSMRL